MASHWRDIVVLFCLQLTYCKRDEEKLHFFPSVFGESETFRLNGGQSFPCFTLIRTSRSTSIDTDEFMIAVAPSN